MADKLMRVQVIIPVTSGIPEDAITNTLYFDGDDGDTDAAYHSAARQLVVDFYNAIDGVIFPNTVDTTATIKIYDMRDPEPRLPEFIDTFTLTPTANNPFPSEVSICLSFSAQQVSGVPAARRRGRIFLGPITDAIGSFPDDQCRPSSTALTAIASAAGNMENGEAITPGSVKWAVYSPTTDATSSIDDAFNDVVDGWVDNAFDTQRRRGPVATSRTLFT